MPGESSYDSLCKITIIGDKEVGKSAIVRQYTGVPFNNGYNPTLMNLKSSIQDVRGKKVKTQIWDTSEINDLNSCLSGSEVVILVFDLTSLRSLTNVATWLTEVKRHVPNCPIIFVGNKADLVTERRVGKKEEVHWHLNQLAGHTCSYFEVSAKTGEQVDKVFAKVIEDTLAKITRPKPNSQAQPVSASFYLKYAMHLKGAALLLLIGGLLTGGLGVAVGSVALQAAGAASAVIGGLLMGFFAHRKNEEAVKYTSLELH